LNEKDCSCSLDLTSGTSKSEKLYSVEQRPYHQSYTESVCDSFAVRTKNELQLKLNLNIFTKLEFELERQFWHIR